MAKYIIDVPEDMTCLNALRYDEDGKCVSAKSYLIPNLTPYVRSESYIDGLKKGQNEVWEFVRCIMEMNANKYRECFDNFACKYTYQEAKKIYGEWKKEKGKIHVGDEVEQITASGNPTGLKCVVTKIVDDEILKGITQTGEIVSCFSQIKKWWRKTGRHFNEVEKLLRKMGVE